MSAEPSTAAPAPDPMLPEMLPLVSRSWQTADTFDLVVDVKGRRGFAFAPGQFNMLYAFGVGEVPISISGDPGKPDRLVHTIRAVGAVTRRLGQLGRGDQIGVRGPYGTAWPVDQAVGKDVVIVAGGIGLAPLRPVIYSVLRRPRDFGRLVLVYGARTPADMLYRAELERWGKRKHVAVDATVDRGDPGWEGHTGVVTKLLDHQSFDRKDVVAMLCGPEVMMRFAAWELEELGVGRQSIYVSGERNMKCGVGLCGHCQLGRHVICRHGPVFRYDQIAPLMLVREL